jgi:uncharacterized protein (TIGR03437 family)
LEQEASLKPVSLVAVLILACAAAFAQTPAVATGGVLNAASYDKTNGVPPGALVAIFGTDLAASLTQADSVPLATSLGGTSVTFNNVAAPLLFVSGGQINAQLPWDTPPGTSQVVVKRGNNSSTTQNFQVAAAVPGIFTLSASGIGQAVAYGNSDQAFAAPVGSVSPPYTAHPAKIGDPTTLVILATGLGPVTPPVSTGGIPPSGQLSRGDITPTVLVGGVAANVFFSGMSPYVGVFQLNIIIQPGTPTGDKIPLQIRMNGITTTDQVTIAVSN